MHKDESTSEAGLAIDKYFSQTSQISAQEALGKVVIEIIEQGLPLSRSSVCARLLFHFENTADIDQKRHYQSLIKLLLNC